MVYVAVYTGLRVSELVGLKWGDVQGLSITIDERYCRGDWGAPKSEASNATIPVNCNGPRSLRPMFSRYFPASFSDSFQCWVTNAG